MLCKGFCYIFHCFGVYGETDGYPSVSLIIYSIFKLTIPEIGIETAFLK